MTQTPAPNRTIDGTRNNLQNPRWGAAGEKLLRVVDADYANDGSTIRDAGRPNPREISNVLCSQGGNRPNTHNLTEYVWAWGQFLDHELDLTGEAVPEEKLPITVPDTDPDYAKRTIPFHRSSYDPATGLNKNNPRQQINQITSYIDASNVYGSSADRASALRTFFGGKLKTSPGPDGPLLPRNECNLPNAGGLGTNFHLAGDIRANEHVVLLAMHTLFVREHNRLCEDIARQNPNFKDEQIYQRARKIVGALMQVVTYNEFLPALLGPNALAPYQRYDDTVNAGVNNEFSTACYRVGHSMLSSNLPLMNSSGLPLREGFFRPEIVEARGIEPFLEGLASSKMQQIDTHIVDEVRTFLFRHVDDSPNQLLDLAALNIQRGRDHGIAPYNACRLKFGLSAKKKFESISADAHVVHGLRSLYKDVDDIDAWIGGLAEDHFQGAPVGELIQTVLKDQFERARNGDRYWYENDPAFSVADRKTLHGVNGAERSPIFGTIRCPIFCGLRDSHPGGYPVAALPSSSFTGTFSTPALRLLFSL